MAPGGGERRTVYITRGIHACGKTGWAMQFVNQYPEKVRRVSAPDIRRMLTGGIRNDAIDSIVWYIRDQAIRRLLDDKLIVIVDDCHLDPIELIRIANVAGSRSDVKIETWDTPLEECIARDAERPDSIGEEIIRKQYQEYVSTGKILEIPEEVIDRRSGKCTEEERSARIDGILDMLLAGAPTHHIIQFVTAETGLSERMIRFDIEEARKRMRTRDSLKRAEKISEHLTRRGFLYYQAVNANDWPAALRILQDQAELEGLYPAKSVNLIAGDAEDSDGVPVRKPICYLPAETPIE